MPASRFVRGLRELAVKQFATGGVVIGSILDRTAGPGVADLRGIEESDVRGRDRSGQVVVASQFDVLRGEFRFIQAAEFVNGQFVNLSTEARSAVVVVRSDEEATLEVVDRVQKTSTADVGDDVAVDGRRQRGRHDRGLAGPTWPSPANHHRRRCRRW